MVIHAARYKRCIHPAQKASSINRAKGAMVMPRVGKNQWMWTLRRRNYSVKVNMSPGVRLVIVHHHQRIQSPMPADGVHGGAGD